MGRYERLGSGHGPRGLPCVGLYGRSWQPEDGEDENEEPEYPWELLSPYAGDVAPEDGDSPLTRVAGWAWRKFVR